MNILISNDDGISAPGLAALVAAVGDLGQVTVVAPDSPQSASGHGITLTRPLTVEYVRMPGTHSFEGMAVDGRPADCVRLAIRNLMPQKPDLVLSGLNAGANVGINVFYSGTVAAAAEAAMIGIPAVAFSAAMPDDECDFVAAAGHCRKILDMLLSRGLQPGELINVNIPRLKAGLPKGTRVCEQSDADVTDKYTRQDSPEGIERYRIADAYEFNNPHHQSDICMLRQGYTTVTPLKINLTDQEKLASLRACCES